jgi:hypothetical protein
VADGRALAIFATKSNIFPAFQNRLNTENIGYKNIQME